MKASGITSIVNGGASGIGETTFIFNNAGICDREEDIHSLAVLYAAAILVYTTTKAAVKALTNTLSQFEWENTRINAIVPSLTKMRIINDFPPDLTELSKGQGFMQAEHIAERFLN
ncbi:hypothetical protein CONCODRAFT_9628 [Conidiobolus coronatus NRRL 28638]|uniref:NAD(P)-binding protein n=1 Tax=Conidiobolus coronatus (strain ATCC 28846 / CBS 209.66 / NRRL 28638) TaxID=796925 RepID=A0A137NZB0_CONC2|nr:hypothetical protein CONCODRAFT_9628 [Conidiobolus coronatus NRRL 28638]|eukprot:KXN68155.1 hypothetical protein CONCODRAFT_9628 [Conidiobolus coronatus NRRL 28638]